MASHQVVYQPDGYQFDSGGNVVNQPPVDDKKSYSSWNGDWFGYLQYMADKDPAFADKYIDYMMGEQSAATAREWTAQREDSQFQRFSEDARKAGFNPVALLNLGGSPVSSSSSGNSYNGSQFTSKDSNKRNQETSIARGVLAAFAMIMGVLLAL